MGSTLTHLVRLTLGLGVGLILGAPLSCCAPAPVIGEEPGVEQTSLVNKPAEPEGTTSSDGAPAEPEGVVDIKIVRDLRPSLDHGPKGAEDQRYIVIHDTEGGGEPEDVVDWWDGNGNLVGSHFVIGRDGRIVQAVELDRIAHHAGFGDTGHNALYGTVDESRDDKHGTTPIGDWAADYGMNSYSIGIELIHEGARGEDYPEAQLDALDTLIAYIDGHYGFESEIIDHKSWRTGNSDTSAEFAPYLESYRRARTHDGH